MTVMNVKIEKVHELKRGEALMVNKQGDIRVEQILPPQKNSACSFERVYFSRGSDKDIYQERKSLGRNLVEPILHGGSTYKSPKPFKIERDWSAAAMMICIGAIAGKIRMKGLSFNSHQPDSIIIPILCRCGADIELQGFSHNIYQTFSATTINRSLLIPFAVDITDIPDLFPALFILALRCAGPSVIQGISRLRNKESDRAATFFKEFTKLGVKMEIKDEEMTIWGSPMMTVLGGKVSSHGDHRLAMHSLL